MAITWIGHATVLIELDGARVLTDPVLGGWAGPLRRMAPSPALEASDRQRRRRPRLAPARRPRRPAVAAAARRARAHGRPARRAGLAGERGIPDVTELRPGEELQAGPLRVEATSRRTRAAGIRSASTSRRWASWCAGRARSTSPATPTSSWPWPTSRGTIDVALLPVWGWGRSLGPGHLDPERAAQAAARIAPRVAIPIHWGTFSLPWPYPAAERPAGAGARVRDRGGPDRARGRRPRAAAGRAGGAAVKRTLPVLRILIVWVATALTLLLLSVLLSGFHVEDFGAALVASALIGLINAFVWPFVIRVALPLTVLTLGLGGDRAQRRRRPARRRARARAEGRQPGRRASWSRSP